MRMVDTNKMIEQYVSDYNTYVSLPDDSKELKKYAKKLTDQEEILTRRFILENGYMVSNDSLYVKENV